MPEIHNLLVDSEDGQYLYYFVPHAKPLIRGGKTPEASVENMRTFVRGNYRKVLRKVTEDDTLSDSAIPGYLNNLRGLGNQLYNVIPDKLKGAARNMKKGDFLHIYADELISIPWELVKNGGDFWGQLYVVSNSTVEGPARVDPTPLKVNLRKVLNVVGYGIHEEAASRARKLFEGLHVQLTLIDGADHDATSKFYEQLPTADLIHFTGHGEIGPNGAYLRIVENEEDFANFMVTSIGPDSLQPGCIIFANACLSSEKTTVVCQSIGFGPKFCECGASAFIGTLDLVPSRPAVLFAENFYRRLFSGDEAGRALWAAKQVPLKYEGSTSLAPLLYSLYGNPLSTVELTR
jgi:hypothetical protein